MRDEFDFENEFTPVVDLPTGKETAKSESGRRRRLSFASWVDLVGVSLRSALRRVSASEQESIQLTGDLKKANEERHKLELAFEKHRVLTVGADGNNGKIGTLRADTSRRLDDMDRKIAEIESEATASVKLVKRLLVAGILAIGGSLGSGWVAVRDTIAAGAVRANEITHIREELREVKEQLKSATSALMNRKD